MRRLFLLGNLFLASPPLVALDTHSPIKEAPKRPSLEAEVVMEEFDTLDDCPAEKICVEGLLANTGAKPAYNVRLAVEIGGTKHTKPRLVLPFKVDQSIMQPGDRQEVFLTLDRKISTKHNGKEKVLEVGRYNFKVVPKWSRAPAQKTVKSP